MGTTSLTAGISSVPAFSLPSTLATGCRTTSGSMRLTRLVGASSPAKTKLKLETIEATFVFGAIVLAPEDWTRRVRVGWITHFSRAGSFDVASAAGNVTSV